MKIKADNVDWQPTTSSLFFHNETKKDEGCFAAYFPFYVHFKIPTQAAVAGMVERSSHFS